MPLAVHGYYLAALAANIDDGAGAGKGQVDAPGIADYHAVIAVCPSISPSYAGSRAGRNSGRLEPCLPESFIFALLGSGFADHPQLRLWCGIILLVVFSLFFIWYFRRSKEGAKILAAMRKE